MTLDADARRPGVNPHAGLGVDGADTDVAIVHGGKDLPLARARHELGDGTLRPIPLAHDHAIIHRTAEGVLLPTARAQAKEVIIDKDTNAM